MKRRARAKAVTIDAVREVALALPDATERPSYGTPGFRADDKLFARVLDDDHLVVRMAISAGPRSPPSRRSSRSRRTIWRIRGS